MSALGPVASWIWSSLSSGVETLSEYSISPASTSFTASPAGLKAAYPWIQTPLIIQAPTRPYATASLAVAVSRAGGIGIISNVPGRTAGELAIAAKSFAQNPLPSTRRASKKRPVPCLPVGVGYLIHSADIRQARAEIAEYRPAIVWLFAPSPPSRPEGTLGAWADMVRASSPATAVWVQVGSVRDAMRAVRDCAAPAFSIDGFPYPPLTLVIQGADAGGHGLMTGAGLVPLLPEVADELAAQDLNQGEIALMAAGGVMEARGVAAALALGAHGVVLGTRFLASDELEAPPGFRASVVAARDGGQTTTRTTVFDRLRGTKMGGEIGGWPEEYGGRGIKNLSITEYEVDGEEGFGELKDRFESAQRKADPARFGLHGRDVTYVGTGVGLVSAIMPAAQIVEEVRGGAVRLLKSVGAAL